MSDHNPHDVEVRFDILHTKRYIFKAHSNEAIRTGRVHVFDSGECCRMGRWL